jgi:diguanylate cyclase (GGDEF)-like protein
LNPPTAGGPNGWTESRFLSEIDHETNDDRRSFRPRFNAVAIAVTASSVAVIVLSMLVIAARVPWWLAAMAGLISGAMAGSILGGLVLAQRYFEEHAALARYITRLSNFSIKNRSDSFQMLLAPGTGPIAELSEHVHRLVTEVYGGYTEAMHLRRTINETIQAEVRKARKRLSHIAYIDNLTGLSNRRALEETMPDILESAKREHFDCVCLTVDVDFFKDVNDRLGHDQGDEILKHLADSVRTVVRESDMAFRLGGDEFVILLIDINIDGADEAAGRLQRQFAQMAWPNSVRRLCPKPTLSIGGVSLVRTGAMSAVELLRFSDEAMYGAKRAGKGRENVVGASGASARNKALVATSA